MLLGWWTAAGLAAVLAHAGTATAQLLSDRDGVLDLPTFRNCSVCPEMVILPGGDYQMGAAEADPDAYDNEEPRHEVTIGYSFAIGITEVTFTQWDACVAYDGCRHRPNDLGWGRGDLPAMDISWNDASDYVAWLSGHTGLPYRLPSEAEWEYAARAGESGPHFWQRGTANGCDFANLADSSARTVYPEWSVVACDDGFAVNAPVGGFRPNRFGLYDVLGNVWEWVDDCWNPSYAGAPANGSSWRTGDCTQRVLRGGAATGLPREVRLSQRGLNEPDLRAAYNGLRVVMPMDGN